MTALGRPTDHRRMEAVMYGSSETGLDRQLTLALSNLATYGEGLAILQDWLKGHLWTAEDRELFALTKELEFKTGPEQHAALLAWDLKRKGLG